MTLSEPTRNLALEIVRVTEAAALASGRWMGRGEKERADQAAVEAMRLILSAISMDGVIVIIILLAAILLVTFLLHTMMPRQLANVSQCIKNDKVKTTFLGFILLFSDAS